MGALKKLFRPAKGDKRPLGSAVALLIGVALAIGTVLAASINLGAWIELGAGVVNTDECARKPITSFDQNFVSTANGDESRITKITVEGIPVSCDGKYLRLTVYSANNTVLESVVWRLAKLGANDTSINAITDGTTISNSSSNNISQNYPASETDPLGLRLGTVDPAAISSFNLESSSEVLTEN